MLKKPNTKKAKAAAKKTAKPKAPAEAEKKHPDVFEEVQAPYHFTPEERGRMSDTMRSHMDKIDELTDQQKASNADFKLRLQNETNNVKALRQKLNSGEETRPVRARVEFEPDKRVKHLMHPETGELIRTDPMQPADFQLPMFLPAETENGAKAEAVAPKGAQDVPTGLPPATKAKKKKDAPAAEPGDNAGKTNVGDALDAAASLTDAPKIDLYIDEITDHVALTRGFRKAAAAAGWTKPQIALMVDLLKKCDNEDAMKETLRPHIVEHPSEKPQ